MTSIVRMRSNTSKKRSWVTVATATSRVRRSSSSGIARTAAMRGAGSSAARSAASSRSSFVSKTRKIVPSATPAADAIWRVVTDLP